MKDKKEFNQFIVLISEKYGKEVSEAMAMMVWQAIKDFPDQLCARAFNHVIARGRFLKDLLPDLLEYLEGKPEDKAIAAWQGVMAILSRYYPGETVSCGDDIDQAVRALGGWDRLSLLSHEELKWEEKRFREHHGVIMDRVALPEWDEHKLIEQISRGEK